MPFCPRFHICSANVIVIVYIDFRDTIKCGYHLFAYFVIEATDLYISSCMDHFTIFQRAQYHGIRSMLTKKIVSYIP